jgi:hypothetical protein
MVRANAERTKAMIRSLQQTLSDVTKSNRFVIGIVAANLANFADRKFFYDILRRPRLAC